MKSLITSTFLALAIVLSAHSAHAQVADVATSTPVYAGGWSSPCFYVRQTHEGEKGFTCNDSEYSMTKFALDSIYRESILSDWRYRIFVLNPAKYR